MSMTTLLDDIVASKRRAIAEARAGIDERELERRQLLEARLSGADAVLLIAEILDGLELSRLLQATWDLGMEALVELYDADNLPRVLDSGARLIGVNNRDLRTFAIRLDHTLEL